MGLILINGNVHTMDDSVPYAEGIAARNGRIIAVGSSGDVLRFKTDESEIIDLGGRMVVPGFNDTHMHLLNFGASLGMVDLGGCRSIEDIVTTVKRTIDEKGIKVGKWVRGRGWNHDYFTAEKRFPTRYDLDRISTAHPIAVTRACGHICVVNSKALEICGINRNTEQVEGGKFDLDQSGEPLGIFRENALSLIFDRMPSPAAEEVKSMLRAAIAYANSRGLTSVQTDDFSHVPDYDFRMVIDSYRQLERSGELTLRVNEQCLLPEIHILKDFLQAGYVTGWGDELFRLGPLKLLSDGSLGARTAALCEPYSDDPSTSGILVYTQPQIDELVRTAHDAGMQIAVHAIGDRAMYMALKALEKALKRNPRKDHRHGIVHCQITDEALLQKFKELNVFAYIQPIFLHYDLHMVEDRIGEKRMEKTYAFKTLLDEGVHIGFGTDCPVEALDTMPSIYCAVTRKDLNGYPDGGWLPDQKLTVEEAVRCYTAEGAWASFEEDGKGSITCGKLADMVVLDRDIFAIEPDEIKDAQVDMTILGGRVVYKR